MGSVRQIPTAICLRDGSGVRIDHVGIAARDAAASARALAYVLGAGEPAVDSADYRFEVTC